MRLILCLLLLSLSTFGRDATKINLVCLNVSEPEVRQYLEHYCRNYTLVKDVNQSDYMVTVMTTNHDLPYQALAIDPVDHDSVDIDPSSTLPGEVKEMCGALHLLREQQP
jgi:hypothetical protein